MDDIEERANSQLMVIEHTYGIKILNRGDLARLIAGGVGDRSEVLKVCSFLNSWIAASGVKGDVTIPTEVLAPVLRG